MPQVQSDEINATTALLALGSNEQVRFGGACEILTSAVAALDRSGLPVIAKSGLYETPGFPPGKGPDFANATVAVQTNLPPHALLAVLHDIETEFARERTERWGPRTLDIDLLAMGDQVLPDRETVENWIALSLDHQQANTPQTLILPHPRLQDRAFVLVPLADIAPAWRHPLLNRTVGELLAALPAEDRAAIVPVPWPAGTNPA